MQSPVPEDIAVLENIVISHPNSSGLRCWQLFVWSISILKTWTVPSKHANSSWNSRPPIWCIVALWPKWPPPNPSWMVSIICFFSSSATITQVLLSLALMWCKSPLLTQNYTDFSHRWRFSSLVYSNEYSCLASLSAASMKITLSPKPL